MTLDTAYDNLDVYVPMSYASWTVPNVGELLLQYGFCLISQSTASITGINIDASAIDESSPAVYRPLQGFPAVGDVDGDGAGDCIFVANGHLVAQRINGVGLYGFPLRVFKDNNSWK